MRRHDRVAYRVAVAVAGSVADAQEAMQNAWAIPTLFGRTQTMAGSKVRTASGEGHNVYVWAPYSSCTRDRWALVKRLAVGMNKGLLGSTFSSSKPLVCAAM